MFDTTDFAAGETPNPHTTSSPNFRPTAQSESERMAAVIIARQKDGRPTSWADLRAAGFTPAQIGAFFPEAAERANFSTFRQDDPFFDPYPDGIRPGTRSAQDEEAAGTQPSGQTLPEAMADEIIRGLKQSRSPIATLQRANRWTGVEIALNLDAAQAIVERRLRRVAPPNRSLVNLAHALSAMVRNVQAEVA